MTLKRSSEHGQSIPKPMQIPDCKCGATAHIVRSARKSAGTLTVELYGVECDRKHHCPVAFSTERSAITFWSEHFTCAASKNKV